MKTNILKIYLILTFVKFNLCTIHTYVCIGICIMVYILYTDSYIKIFSQYSHKIVLFKFKIFLNIYINIPVYKRRGGNA